MVLKNYDPGQVSIHRQVGTLGGMGYFSGKIRPGGLLKWGKELGNYYNCDRVAETLSAHQYHRVAS